MLLRLLPKPAASSTTPALPSFYFQRPNKFKMEAVDSVEDNHVHITDVELVSSYNWTSNGIVVPGKSLTLCYRVLTRQMATDGPPQWVGRNDAPLLEPDSGSRFNDQNSGRCPSSPTEPVIRAVHHRKPDFDFAKLDIISYRYALSCLLFNLPSESTTASPKRGRTMTEPDTSFLAPKSLATQLSSSAQIRSPWKL